MKRFLLAFALLALAVARISAQAPAESPTPAIQSGGEVAAQSAADVWLAIVDDARYEPAYLSTAGIFQKLVGKEQWVKIATAGRALVGKVRVRNVKDSKFSTTMPGAPDGQYVVVHYDTAFEKKPGAVETVTVVLDADGQWKVCGYFIR
jgi:hypothetical protein